MGLCFLYVVLFFKVFILLSLRLNNFLSPFVTWSYKFITIQKRHWVYMNIYNVRITLKTKFGKDIKSHALMLK